METERESIEFDVLFVGAGPACLAGAIRLMQAAKDKGLELEVALIEKGAEIGSHAISGAVMDPVALEELLPDYMAKGCPVEKTVDRDAFYFLTTQKAFALPYVPRYMRNEGKLIVSMSRMTRWLAGIAEDLGVNIFPGFAGQNLLFAEDGRTVIGVCTGDQGLDKDGNPKANFEPGIDLLAKVTILGEGARGSLMKALAARLPIFEESMPQVFEVGIKEVIQLPEENRFLRKGLSDIHLMGYPLGLNTPGGGFIYEMSENRITIGLLTGLCYEDPLLDPFDAFIRFKQHPFVADMIQGGKVLEQGARTVCTGGLYSKPRLAVDGAMFVGGAASFHNTPALKGIHIAMKSGMLAAETALEAVEAERFDYRCLKTYDDRVAASWIDAEMREGRNFAQGLAKKGPLKFVHLGAQYLSGGRGIFDPMQLEADWKTLKPASEAVVDRPDPSLYDGELFVDKLTGVYLSKTLHREDQPPHLRVHDTDLCVQVCYPKYQSPCTRFCPGNVYEMEVDQQTGRRRLKLNPSNCFHCKTCDIKDPFENITWTCPEGGGGPNYTMV